MADQEEALKTCEECGATIYPEHLLSGKAELYGDRLLCVHCLRDQRAGAGSAAPPTAAVDDDAPVVLTDDDTGSSAALGMAGGLEYDKKPTAIRTIGGGASVGQVAEHERRRKLLVDSPNATRCRTFHCKLSDGPIQHMTEQINQWVDGDDNVQIKFATSVIGVVEGKHADPHLILTVFY